jgi:hypothetical protein
MDKRGTGNSAGDFHDATIATLTGDARAAYAALRAHPLIDSMRTGIMATSEGGLLAPGVARFDNDVAFFACRVCPMLSYRDLLAESVEFELRKLGAGEPEMRAAQELMDAQAHFAITGEGYETFADLWRLSRSERWGAVVGVGPIPSQGSASWARFRQLLLADPREMYLRMRSPAFLLFGGDDPIVVASVHARQARELLSASGGREWTVRVVADADHGLMRIEYDESGERQPISSYADAWQQELVRWVVLMARAQR